MAQLPSASNQRTVTEFDANRANVSGHGISQHPLETLQAKSLHQSQLAYKRMLAMNYGIHAAFRQDMDEFILRKAKSGGKRHGLPMGMDILLKRDGTIDMVDILNHPDPMDKTYDLKRD